MYSFYFVIIAQVIKGIILKKVLILFFVLVNTLLGENIPESVDTDDLREVIYNGWSESNQTLNTFIIQKGNKDVPKIVELLDTPLTEAPTEETYSIPKILLSRDDYIILFSYLKYLEKEGEIDQVYNIYVESFKGFKNIPDYSLFSLIYRMVIGDIITKSLADSINNNFFTQDTRKSLKNDLSPLLITNNELLLKTLDNEKLLMLKIIKNMQLKDDSSLIDERLLGFYKKYFIISINEEYPKLSNAIVSNKLKEFEKKKQTLRENHYTISRKITMWLLKSKIELYNFLSIDNTEDDYRTLAKYLVDDQMLVNTPSLNRMYKDYFEMVKENKKLLETL